MRFKSGLKALVAAVVAIAVVSPAWAAPADSAELIVDSTTGIVRLVGNTADPAELTSYQIGSAGGILIPANWNSLQDQGVAGWAEAGGTSALIAEINIASFTSLTDVGIAIGQLVPVGTASGLTFAYGEVGENAVTGTVTYVVPEPAGLAGVAAVGGLVLRRRR